MTDRPFLLGQDFSVADPLCASPFLFFGEAMPVTPAVKAWAGRCAGRMRAS